MRAPIVLVVIAIAESASSQWYTSQTFEGGPRGDLYKAADPATVDRIVRDAEPAQGAMA